jgi:hypothetical protein
VTIFDDTHGVVLVLVVLLFRTSLLSNMARLASKFDLMKLLLLVVEVSCGAER